jgi:peptidoglycan hydrolase CwlO-like protein
MQEINRKITEGKQKDEEMRRVQSDIAELKKRITVTKE